MVVDEYIPTEAAEVEAYLDIQEDIEHEEFALPLHDDILNFLEDQVYNR